VIRRLPDLAEAHMSLGMIRHAQLRYTEAIAELERALKLKPGLKDVRAMLGLDYFHVGEAPKKPPNNNVAVLQAEWNHYSPPPVGWLESWNVLESQ